MALTNRKVERVPLEFPYSLPLQRLAPCRMLCFPGPQQKQELFIPLHWEIYHESTVPRWRTASSRLFSEFIGSPAVWAWVCDAAWVTRCTWLSLGIGGATLPEGGEERIPAGVLWLALSPASCPQGDVLTASGFSPRGRFWTAGATAGTRAAWGEEGRASPGARSLCTPLLPLLGQLPSPAQASPWTGRNSTRQQAARCLCHSAHPSEASGSQSQHSPLNHWRYFCLPA